MRLKGRRPLTTNRAFQEGSVYSHCFRQLGHQKAVKNAARLPCQTRVAFVGHTRLRCDAADGEVRRAFPDWQADGECTFSDAGDSGSESQLWM